MGLILRRKSKCPRCRRLDDACICANLVRAEVRTAAARGRPDPSPRPCPNGCGRTMRGGVCPGPDC